jgi:hypothetical protein
MTFIYSSSCGCFCSAAIAVAATCVIILYEMRINTVLHRMEST